MNLTMDSTIVELALDTCNFVLKPLNREGPGATVGSNLRSKSLPKIAIFQKKPSYLPAFLQNVHTYTSMYFSDPIIKIS